MRRLSNLAVVSTCMCEWKRGTCRLCSCCPLPVTRNGARALQRHWPGTTGDAKVVVTDPEPKPHEVFHGISIVKPWAASLYEGEASPWRGGKEARGRVAREGGTTKSGKLSGGFSKWDASGSAPRPAQNYSENASSYGGVSDHASVPSPLSTPTFYYYCFFLLFWVFAFPC